MCRSTYIFMFVFFLIGGYSLGNLFPTKRTKEWILTGQDSGSHSLGDRYTLKARPGYIFTITSSIPSEWKGSCKEGRLFGYLERKGFRLMNEEACIEDLDKLLN